MQDFESMNVNKVKKGDDTLRFFGCKIWALLPDEIKEAETMEQFKTKVKKWKPNKCPCRLCKTYIQGVGYINYI